MAYATLTGAEHVSGQVSLGASAKTVWAKWRAVVRGRADWLLLLTLFAALQLADIVTTNCAIGLPGNSEANPLMGLSQAHLGTLWWVPKALVAFLVCLAAPLTRRRWFMVFAVTFCTLTVAGNLLAL
jgi:Domain of unknown function (DUF5658)